MVTGYKQNNQRIKSWLNNMNPHGGFFLHVDRKEGLLKQPQIALEALQQDNEKNNLRHTTVISQLRSRLDELHQAYRQEKLTSETHEITLAKKQLKAALTEKDELCEKNEQLTYIIKKLEKEIRGKSSSIEAQNDCLKKNCSSKMNEIIRLKSIIDQQTVAFQDNVENLNRIHQNLEKKMTDCQVLRENNQELLNNKKYLQQTLIEVKSRILEGNKKLEQSLKIAEEAVSEKEAAISREKNLKGEIKRLEWLLQTSAQKKRESVSNELLLAQSHYMKSIHQLSENSLRLEMEIAEKAMLCERDRKEADDIAHHNISLRIRLENMEQEAETKLLTSSKSLFEAHNEINILQRRNQELVSQLATDHSKHERYRIHYDSVLSNLEKELSRCKEENSNVLSSRDELIKENSILSIRVKTSTEYLQREVKKYKDRIASLNEDLLSFKSLCYKQQNDTEKSSRKIILKLYGNIDGCEDRITKLQNYYESHSNMYEERIDKLLQANKDTTKEKYRYCEESQQLKLMIAKGI